MRISIVGAGGVGGLLAGLLARSGEEVAVVARGAHLEAVRRGGLRVESPLGSFTVRVSAAADPAALGPSGAVLVAVKAWQVREVAPRLAPLLGPGAVVVPLQNGVEASSELARALGPAAVAGGVVNVLAWLEGAGRVRHVGDPPRVTMGELPGAGRGGGAAGPRLAPLQAALQRAGVAAELVEDVERAVWEKFLLVEPWGAVAAAARAPLGSLRSQPEARALWERAMAEVAALAAARGVALPKDAVATTAARLDALTPGATASMQRDIGSGRPSELEDQVGAVVRLGRAAGVQTPVHDALYAVLMPQEAAARGRLPPFPRT
ncbi:MAG TPA: 2-dehydropantoate 2-reductase [Anaeromyxobacter sp.]|nr:2-dehydropantoate 2-reductase [Anaeromyxobacter sp.]